MGQKYGKCRAMPYRRSDLDVAALHGDDLMGKVQSYADALNIVYFFFPVKAFEDPTNNDTASLTANSHRNVTNHMFSALKSGSIEHVFVLLTFAW